MTGWDAVNEVGDLRAVVADAFEALDELRRGALEVGVEERTAASTAVAAYADQFNLDVASLTVDQRAAAAAVLGDDLFGFVQAVWALDMADRLDHAWRQLLPNAGPEPQPESTGAAGPVPGADALWAAIEGFLTEVARLQVLDPVTTEVVRIRGARAHDCRLCRSLRNVAALEAGADEATFDAVDHFERSDLDERLKVALRLVDAVVWQPRSWPDGVAAGVRATFTPAEAVEIVLDVARNAANKIAVAFEADQPHVTEGVEYFAVDAAGSLTYGLERPGGVHR